MCYPTQRKKRHGWGTELCVVPPIARNAPVNMVVAQKAFAKSAFTNYLGQ
jgi:hypothetical protein